MCVPIGQYQNGEKVVYFPADTLIPAIWAETWGVSKYLQNGDRVKKVQLRGEASFGLAVKLPKDMDWPVGTNVADYFGATKYVQPIRAQCGDAESNHPLFEKFTDIENMRNFPDIFQDGEQIVASEKIHGTNSRIGLIDGVFMAGSKGTRRKMPSEEEMAAHIYWFPLTLPGVKALLTGIASTQGAKQVILFGEVYGPSIQNLHYGVEKGKGFGYRAFSLMVDGKYENYDYFLATCAHYGVETAPIVYRGPFSLAGIRDLSGGKTLVAGDCIREGVVVAPVFERVDPRIGRVILKYVSDQYLFGKNTDYEDV